MKSSAKNIQIASYDDLFKTDAERQADTLERIQELPLDRLVPFPNHPFKVVDDEHGGQQANGFHFRRGGILPKRK